MKAISFDPRGKMLLFLVACFSSMRVTSFLLFIIFAAYLALMLALCGKAKTGVWMFCVFAFFTSINFYALHADAGALTGAVAGICTVFRLFLPTIMAFVLLFQTTKISEFMSAFEKMHMPYVVVVPFTVMFRFLPTVREEWNGIRQAMAFRGIGVDGKGLLLHPIQSAEYILVPLLFSCVNIMDELVAASLARGLDTDKTRTCYFTLQMKYYDYVLCIVNLGFAGVMIAMK